MKEILIKNVTILTMDDENSRFFGWVLLKNGKIDALGEGEPPACSEVLDGEGGVLTPGLIDIHSHLGLYEDGLGFEGADGNEDTDPVTPQMRAIDAVNPMDHAFREALEAGTDVVMDVDVVGALNIKKRLPEAVLVFLTAPSLAEIRRRLEKRGDVSPEAMEKRMERAKWEYSQAYQYDYLVVNDTVGHAAAELLAIMTAEKCKMMDRIHCIKEEL